MRLYYIFSINDEIFNMTKNSPEKLYILLESIYKLNKKDVDLGYRVFESACNFLDKKSINNLIKNLNNNNLNYICFRNSHIINDFYKNESTKITINNTHILMNTNVNNPTFFKELKLIKNVFVCDFLNEDYFFLKKIYTKKYVNV